ncbi:hypothetical protein AVEN_187789-1 [Araneus ventricosus]|uniref:Uncharacterized protein n=1 Tax=Araneus ventricosus TaxID=182803 RepID=A0A4Y2BDA4_ARAVE|nr:hypothetical protein AVEN_187789-1 [Araneus ventricosus]
MQCGPWEWDHPELTFKEKRMVSATVTMRGALDSPSFNLEIDDCHVEVPCQASLITGWSEDRGVCNLWSQNAGSVGFTDYTMAST